MCRLLLTALGAALLLASLSQASVLPSPDSNSLSPSKDPWQELVHDAIIEDVTDDNIVDDEAGDLVDDTADDLADDAEVEEELSEEEKAVGDHVTFPLDQMDDQELQLYLTLEEQIFLGQADEHIAFKLLKEKRSLYTKGGALLRRKRIAPLIARAAFTVGRSLLSRFARSGVTRSGSRLTRHYNGRGSFSDAVRDFNRMRPDNVRSFNGRISGQTGTMGRHRVTVRDGSSGPNSRPTLEIRSHGGDLVRKFRYNN